MDFSELSQAVVEGNANLAKELTQKALDAGTDPLDIYKKGLIPGMGVVGKKMQAGEYYIPEVLLSARAMKQASELVKPLLSSSSASSQGKVLMGTVQGDLHDIGKNLVISMLEGAGFEVTDLGVDVPTEKFVNAAKEMGANIIGMSALLSVTMVKMKEVIDSLENAGQRNKVKVIIGGAPASQKYADEIGADGYAADAGSAVDVAKQVMAA